MMKPSFFEKISTGSNTDSDLRVVRFDQNGMMIEPATTNCTSSIADFDEMPKFKQPIRSEQQHRMQEVKNQIFLKQQQQLQSQFLFEDFKNDDDQIHKPAKLQKQELITQIASSSLLMEDKIIDESIVTSKANENQKDNPQLTAMQPSANSTSEKKPVYSQEEILELQRQYYLGTTASQNETGSPKMKNFKEEQEISLDLEEGDPSDEMTF